MPATRTAVRDALATALSTVDGIVGHAYTPDTPHSGDVIIIEMDVRFDKTMQRGADDMTALCRALTVGDFRSAQENLDVMVTSVRDGLDGDLGGTVHYARVARIRGDSEGQIQVGQQTFAVIDFEVEIVA